MTVCHSKYRQSSKVTSSNTSSSLQHLQNGTIKTLSYAADPLSKELPCVGIFMSMVLSMSLERRQVSWTAFISLV